MRENEHNRMTDFGSFIFHHASVKHIASEGGTVQPTAGKLCAGCPQGDVIC